MTTTRNLADVPLPPGATTVSDWFDPDKPIGAVADPASPDVQRYFCGSRWLIEVESVGDYAFCVQVDGHQRADGRVERTVCVEDWDLSVAAARQFADALTQAADEVERLT